MFGTKNKGHDHIMPRLIIATPLLFGSPSVSDVAKDSNESSLQADEDEAAAVVNVPLVGVHQMAFVFLSLLLWLDNRRAVSFYHLIFDFSDKFMDDAFGVFKL